MEQVAKLRRNWNLAQVLQIVKIIPENYCPWDVIQKIYAKMLPVSCTLILIMMSQIWWTLRWLKIQKLEYHENGMELFYKIKNAETVPQMAHFEKLLFCSRGNLKYISFYITHFCKKIKRSTILIGQGIEIQCKQFFESCLK